MAWTLPPIVWSKACRPQPAFAEQRLSIAAQTSVNILSISSFCGRLKPNQYHVLAMKKDGYKKRAGPWCLSRGCLRPANQLQEEASPCIGASHWVFRPTVSIRVVGFEIKVVQSRSGLFTYFIEPYRALSSLIELYRAETSIIQFDTLLQSNKSASQISMRVRDLNVFTFNASQIQCILLVPLLKYAKVRSIYLYSKLL